MEWRERKGYVNSKDIFMLFSGFCAAGGKGHKGKVTELTDWDDTSFRSAVYVMWESNKKNLYRLGFEGQVSGEESEGRRVRGGE